MESMREVAGKLFHFIKIEPRGGLRLLSLFCNRCKNRKHCLGGCPLNQESILCMEAENLKNIDIFTKKDIINLFQCENDKALRILKVLFQMNKANKIGKYYIRKDSLFKFFDSMQGKEIDI